MVSGTEKRQSDVKCLPAVDSAIQKRSRRTFSMHPRFQSLFSTLYILGSIESMLYNDQS